jgi:beta-glucanase (GH16 family)
VFSDEFDGSRVDPGRWRCNRFGGDSDDAPFNPGSEAAFFSPGNVGVRAGAAVLTARPQPTRLDGRSYTHSSGTLSTEGSFELLPGDHLEARVRVPRGQGLWPAFWTVPSGRWPPETDVFEFFDTDVQSTPQFTYHRASGEQAGPVSYGDPSVDHRDSWHVYGLLRGPDRLVPYVDGVAFPAAAVPDPDDLPQFIVLSLSVYAGASPPVGAEMAVDWVRAWRRG